jgi:transcriptional accessory protein Tex/SPT6
MTNANFSEAGASVYSVSDIAKEEFPNLDCTMRGTVSFYFI